MLPGAPDSRFGVTGRLRQHLAHFRTAPETDRQAALQRNFGAGHSGSSLRCANARCGSAAQW